MIQNGKLVPHRSGAYLQAMPVDKVTGLAAIPFKDAEERGALKIDFLNLNFYEHFNSREEMLELLKLEPDWNLLMIPSVVEELSQVKNSYDLIQQVKPKSVLELADCLALIRPKKRFMLDKYLENPERIRPLLYGKEEGGDGYGFKKAHAIAYAMMIVLQLHFIKAGLKV